MYWIVEYKTVVTVTFKTVNVGRITLQHEFEYFSEFNFQIRNANRTNSIKALRDKSGDCVKRHVQYSTIPEYCLLLPVI